MAAQWERLKTGLGIGPEPVAEPESLPSQLLHQLDEATTLSKTQRVYGFAICLGLGLLFGFLSSVFFLMPVKFAILYTLANLLFIGSTMFLMGPLAQFKKMFEKGRIIATCLYFGAMFITLWMAIKLHSFPGTILALLVQMGALIWYCMSYIPFARAMATKMFSSFISG
ncbi:hypothetical protein WJX82_008342 [Trebouxia sp. C0006]